jgi:cation transport ATPase
MADEPSPTCLHCGGPFLATVARNAQGDVFCCQGCLEVHAMLGGKGWEQFYALLEQGGGQAPRAQGSREYDQFLATLRSPESLTGLGTRSGDYHTVSLISREVNCAACGFLIENILREHAAVKNFEVDFIHGDLDLTYDMHKAHLADLLAVMARVGFRFRLRDIGGTGPDHSASGATSRPPIDRSLVLRMAVSGASFANAMAFSLANYFGLFKAIDLYWAKAFGWFALIAALPAALYGGSFFFAGAWRALRARVFSIDLTVSIGIVLALIVSLEAVFAGRPEASYADSLAGLVFFLLVGRWAVRSFEASLVLRSRWFEALRPALVLVQREGAPQPTPLPLDAVRPGDHVRLLPATYAPFDGILLSPRAVVEMSVLTGESRRKELRQGDPLFAGARLMDTEADIQVSATPGSTRIAGLLQKLASLQQRRSQPDRMREHVALIFTSIVALVALAAFAVHWSEGWRYAFLTAASVFIISCACALALAVPISRGLGLKRAFSLGFHFRSQDVLERLAQTQVVLFDKTGTLSFSERKLRAWAWMPHLADATEQNKIAVAIQSLCRHSRHPVAVSLAEGLAADAIAPTTTVPTIHTNTSSPSLKVTEVREVLHLGLFGTCRLGEETLQIAIVRGDALQRPHLLAEHGLQVAPKPSALSDEVTLPIASPMSLPMALPMATPTSALFCNGYLVALASLSEEIRPDVPALVAQLRKQGIYTALLSGDEPEHVAAFAKQCGFTHFAGGLSPEAKQAEAARLKASHGFTVAIGDGFNDSLLLGEADIGLAVAGDLPMVAEGADGLFTGNSPAALVDLLAVSHGVKKSLVACYAVSGLYNALSLTAAFAGWVSPLFAAILMPLSSVTLGITAYLAIPRKGS